MFPTKAMKILVRDSQFNYGEWPALLESRRVLAKQLLSSGDLPTLGELVCLRHEWFRHSISTDFSLNFNTAVEVLGTKGIFKIQPWESFEYVPNSGYQPGLGGLQCRDGLKRAWGLTSSNEWVVVEIRFVGQSGYKGRGYERAVEVKIIKVDLGEMLAQTIVNPRAVWDALGEAIRVWEKHRRDLYESAANIAKIAEAEDSMLFAVLEES